MKRLIVIAIGTLMALAASAAHAATLCTSGLISNYYAVEISGNTAQQGFCAGTGIVIFRASGDVELVLELSCAGTSESWSGAGTYSVAKSCMGQASIALDFGADLDVDMTIAEGGNVLALVVNYGSVETFIGSARKL